MYMIQNKIKFGFTLTYTWLIMNKNIKLNAYITYIPDENLAPTNFTETQSST